MTVRQRQLAWTPERVALLREAYPHEGASAGMLAAVNALPGVPVASLEALRCAASKFKVTAMPEAQRRNARAGRWGPVTAPAVPPGEDAPAAGASLAQRHARASDLLRRARPDSLRRDAFQVASAIAAQTRLPPREVLRLWAEIRDGARRA